jgi:signal transduction histidine kinase
VGAGGDLDAQLRELEKLKADLHFEDSASSLAELVEILGQGLSRTHRLVDDLQDFASPGDRRVADVDVIRGIETTAQLVGHHLREAGVDLRMELPERLPPVSGDPRAINQVFLNLLKNAAEALEGRGGVISVRATQEEGSVVVQIRDDGPGIAQDLLPRVFEPFYSTKGAGRGTGLGLSISRRIIAEHDGTIEVSSIDGEGASFTVQLPVQGDCRET